MRDLLRLYRVREWAHILPLPLATFDTTVPLDVALPAAARGVANAFALLAFGFLLNAVSDRHVDRDPRKNPLIVPGASGYHASLAGLPVFSLTLAYFSPWPAQVATLACLLLGWAYSVGPRLKSLPIVGTVLNAVGFTPILFLGAATETLPAGLVAMAVAFAGLLLQNQLIHEAADRGDDRASGIVTTWIAIGPRWTATFAAASGFAAAVAASQIVARPSATIAIAAMGVVFVVAFPLALSSARLTADRAARLRIVHRWCAVSCGALLFVGWRVVHA